MIAREQLFSTSETAFAVDRNGMTVAQIATAMNVSSSTVRNHTQHVLLKLHVHSRFEAVALGRKLNLI
jgi:DNA-binding NarL/FixJ family response regulator